MIQKLGIIALAAMLAFVADADAQGNDTLEGCRDLAAQEGRLSKLWNDLRNAFESHRPTEAERLSKLRTALIELSSSKNTLIDHVREIANAESATPTPGTLKDRAKKIPELQAKIEELLSSLRDEIKQGGLLAGNEAVRPFFESLHGKRAIILCKLSHVPFPMSKEQREAVKELLISLEEEKRTMEQFDSTLTKLIAEARAPQSAQQPKP